MSKMLSSPRSRMSASRSMACTPVSRLMVAASCVSTGPSGGVTTASAVMLGSAETSILPFRVSGNSRTGIIAAGIRWLATALRSCPIRRAEVPAGSSTASGSTSSAGIITAIRRGPASVVTT